MCVLSSELSSKLQDTLELIEEQLDFALSKTCTKFDKAHYEKLQMAYTLLGKRQVCQYCGCVEHRVRLSNKMLLYLFLLFFFSSKLLPCFFLILLPVSEGKECAQVLVNHLEDQACPGKVQLGKKWLNMTLIVLTGLELQTSQPNIAAKCHDSLLRTAIPWQIYYKTSGNNIF